MYVPFEIFGWISVVMEYVSHIKFILFPVEQPHYQHKISFSEYLQ